MCSLAAKLRPVKNYSSNEPERPQSGEVSIAADPAAEWSKGSFSADSPSCATNEIVNLRHKVFWHAAKVGRSASSQFGI